MNAAGVFRERCAAQCRSNGHSSDCCGGGGSCVAARYSVCPGKFSARGTKHPIIRRRRLVRRTVTCGQSSAVTIVISWSDRRALACVTLSVHAPGTQSGREVRSILFCGQWYCRQIDIIEASAPRSFSALSRSARPIRVRWYPYQFEGCVGGVGKCGRPLLHRGLIRSAMGVSLTVHNSGTMDFRGLGRRCRCRVRTEEALGNGTPAQALRPSPMTAPTPTRRTS